MEEQNNHKRSTRIKIVSMGDAEVGKVLKKIHVGIYYD